MLMPFLPRRRNPMFDQNENEEKQYLLDHEYEATQPKRHHDRRLNRGCPEEVIELVATDRAHRDAKKAAHARHAAERAPRVFSGQRRVLLQRARCLQANPGERPHILRSSYGGLLRRIDVQHWPDWIGGHFTLP